MAISSAESFTQSSHISHNDTTLSSGLPWSLNDSNYSSSTGTHTSNIDTPKEDPMFLLEKYILTSMSIFIVAIGTTGNVASAVGFIKNGITNKKDSGEIILLAIIANDMFVTALYHPFQVMAYWTNIWKNHQIFCAIFTIGINIRGIFAVGFNAFLALRMHCKVKALSSAKYFTKRLTVAFLSVYVCTVFIILFPVPFLLANKLPSYSELEYRCPARDFYSGKSAIFGILQFMIILIGVSVILWSYISLYVYLRNASIQIRKSVIKTRFGPAGKLSLGLGINLCISNMIYLMVGVILVEANPHYGPLIRSFKYPVHISAVINPILYFVFLKTLRGAFRCADKVGPA